MSGSAGGAVNEFLGGSSADDVFGCIFHHSTNLGSRSGVPDRLVGFESFLVGSTSITALVCSKYLSFFLCCHIDVILESCFHVATSSP